MRMTPVIAVIQARMSSTRLPGKVMREVCGRPLLWHLVNRLRRCMLLDGMIVATSTEGSDDVIERWCAENSVDCYRGEIDDVLTRFCGAAAHSGANTIVRITADCPLIDPVIVDRVVDKYSRGGCDYVATATCFPDGLDVEIFSAAAIERAAKLAMHTSEREHVTPYIREHPGKFSVAYVYLRSDLSHMRWTVDDERDLKLVTKIFEALGPDGEAFGMQEILELLGKDPSLIEINAGTPRNEGYTRSLKEDRNIFEK